MIKLLLCRIFFKMLCLQLGLTVGIFLSDMNARGFSFSNVHVIGHSLGAHVGSVAGQSIQSSKNIIARLHIYYFLYFYFH